MGNSCGTCCEYDQNVDLHQALDSRAKPRKLIVKNGSSSSKPGDQLKINMDIDEIMNLPKEDKVRRKVEQIVSKVTALVKGYLARLRFKRLYFLHLTTGRKAHQVTQAHLEELPYTDNAVVNHKEKLLGRLPLTQQQVKQIEQYRQSQEFKNGLVMADGQLYAGHVNYKDEKHGYGLQVWPDGSKYEGFWSNNLAKGFGRFILADGDVYQGEWLEDKAHGEGEYYYAEGAVYKGGWLDDKQHGKGREEWPDGSFYDGEYIRGKKDGHGTFQWADGAIYVGYWKENKMDGKGEFKWADGRTYLGDYSNDKKHGQGVYMWPDGRLYQGTFTNGKQHGKGVYR